MSSSRSWLHQDILDVELNPGNIIRNCGPSLTNWRILQVLETHDCQAAEGSLRPSYTSIKMRCCVDGDLLNKAFVKFYVQLPWLNTDSQESDIRAKQATSWDPREFIALKTLSEDPEVSRFVPRIFSYTKGQQKQHPLVPVPGGFLNCFIWELVTGQKLGDFTGAATVFWLLEKWERDMVRSAFQEVIV
jgi:hypothetical protein